MQNLENIKNEAEIMDGERGIKAWRRAAWILAGMLVVLGAVSATYIIYMQKYVVSEADLAALANYKEVAEQFAQSLHADLPVPQYVERVYNYGISEDGDFYLHYNLCYDENDEGLEGCRDTKVYFWESEDDEHHSYGFSYDE